MPRTAQRVQRRGYHLSAMATTARWPPEQRRVVVPLAASKVGITSLPHSEQPGITDKKSPDGQSGTAFKTENYCEWR
ncbi:hypothetical protein MRX96_033270 [Rhipicephalus microplus]